MIVCADESVDKAIVESIRRLGFNAISVTETTPGIPDTLVLSRANELGAVVLTADKDFGELVYRHRQAHSGVILIRLADRTSEERSAIVAAAVQLHAGEFEFGFAVVTAEAVRIRRLLN